MRLRRLPTCAAMVFLTCGALVVGAQAADKVYRIGLLAPGVEGVGLLGPGVVKAFEKRGYTTGHNVEFVRAAARGDTAALAGLARQLADARVDVLLTIGYPAAAAAKQNAPNIPIVAVAGGDPVATGLIDSLSHPGGHVTGVSDLSSELSAKRLQMLKFALPGIHTVAVLWNMNDLGMTLRYHAVHAAAPQLGLSIVPLGIRAPDDFAVAFAAMEKEPPDAVMMVTDSLTNLNRQKIIEFANAHHLPSMFEYGQFVNDGGMMSYGPDQQNLFDRGAELADRILRGQKPAELPAELPTVFDFDVNMKTANALGISLAPAVLAQATHVVE